MDRTLRDGRVGVFCTQNCWNPESGSYLYELFQRRGNLAAIFKPRDAELTPGTNHILFDEETVKGLNAVIVEIQDIGVRYFNYTKDVMKLMSFLETLGAEGPSLYIIDHINPAGRIVEGTIPTVTDEAYVPKVAHRHGLTLGELAHLYYSEIGAKFPLHIISARACAANRAIMPWTIAPASDIPGMFSYLMYSGGGLWNNTNITPGIGTARPYEYFGAPFIRHSDLDQIPVPEGVMLRPCSFTPTVGRYQNERCFGYQIILTPDAEYHSLLHTLEMMGWFKEHYSEFEFSDGFFLKLADPVLEAFLKGDITFDVVQEHIKLEEQKWIRKAKRYVLYEDTPVRIK